MSWKIILCISAFHELSCVVVMLFGCVVRLGETSFQTIHLRTQFRYLRDSNISFRFSKTWSISTFGCHFFSSNSFSLAWLLDLPKDLFLRCQSFEAQAPMHCRIACPLFCTTKFWFLKKVNFCLKWHVFFKT